MSTLEIALTIISVMSSISSITFAVLAFSRNRKKDTQEETTGFVSMRVDLMYIKDGINDLKRDLSTQKDISIELDKRLTAVETKLDTHINNKTIHSSYKKG